MFPNENNFLSLYLLQALQFLIRIKTLYQWLSFYEIEIRCKKYSKKAFFKLNS